MNIMEHELLEYIRNCREADTLRKQIASLENYLNDIEKATDCKFRLQTLDLLAEESHKLRIRKLGLEINLNTVERKILQFELAEELRD